MKLNPDVVNSLNENLVEIGGCWGWFSSDVYSPGYREILSQPLSMDTSTLDYISVKDPITTITIRSGYTSASPLVFNPISYNVNEFEDELSHNSLNGLQGGLSGNFYHISEPIFSYTSGISADVQRQINTTNFNLQTSSTSLQNQIDTLAQQSISGMGAGTINRIGKFVTSASLGDSSIFDDGSVVKVYNKLSASGNISGNSFIKNGGTSTQFLKANGSSDSNVYITSSSLSPYTLLTTTSAISANLQSQINNDKNSLSAYLPLSGGNVYGRLYLGDSSNNGYLDLKTNGSSAGQTDINYRGGTSALRRMTIRYDEIKDAIEIFSSNDDGSARTNIQRMYRDQNTPSRYYTGLDIATGNLSVQSLSASKLVATDASKNLISYTLTSADIPDHAFSHHFNGTDPINGQSLSGLLVTSTPTFSTLKLVKSLGTTLSAATRIELLNNDSTYGQSFWSDSGGNLRLAFLQGDSIWSDRFTFFRTGALSAVGNITANSFIKNGGTSTQFLKADGSSDSNTYASQSFVNANYLPLAGGNVYGSTIFGNSTNSGYVSIRTNGTSAGQGDLNFLGSTSAARRLTFRYNEITDALEFFTSNDNGSARANKMLVYRSSSSATNFYTGLNVATGNLSVQSLSASKLVATDSSKNLISYTLTSADIPTISNLYLPLSGGILTGDVQTGNLIRNDFGLWDIGTSLKRYNTIYGTNGDYYWLSASYLNVESSFLPYNSLQVDLGSTTKRFRDLYIKNTYSNAFETTDTSFTSRYTHNFGNNTTSAATHVQVHFQARPLVINVTSGDMYWSGSRFVVMDNTGANKQLAYTTDLAYYTPTSGFNQTISAYLPLSGGTLNSYLAFNNGGNNTTRGISGDIGSSESWELAGKASTTGAGDVRINLYTSSVSQMVPFYITQYSGGTQQNSITLMNASGKSGFNDISTQKITNNVIGNIGYVQDQTQISDTGISANNFVTNSSIIMQNAGRTADKIKIYDNLIQMRSGVSDPFVQLSASYNGTSGVFLNVSTANPSYPAILTSEIALLTSGFGIRGKTTYLKGDAPIIYTSAASTTKIEQLCQIMHDMGFIRYI